MARDMSKGKQNQATNHTTLDINYVNMAGGRESMAWIALGGFVLAVSFVLGQSCTPGSFGYHGMHLWACIKPDELEGWKGASAANDTLPLLLWFLF
ncbi:hypothetical protein M8818_002503 [Zalaria obscura]|uniref:Uncharacterized protein n=1 Tax=Zalaria obscura TaxID=2024903 RepID=A0ACC3SH77_9PEZI